jgi:periplasmic protein CpxP/Spy
MANLDVWLLLDRGKEEKQMGTTRMALVTAAVLIALGGLGQAGYALAEQGMDAPPGQTGGKYSRGHWQEKDRLERMSTRLNLTEAQQTAIRPILDDEAAQFRALRDDASLDRIQKRAKIRALVAATFDRINDVLTLEQRKRHEEMRDKAIERWKKRHGQPSPEADR